jgi:hypothetical protein
MSVGTFYWHKPDGPMPPSDSGVITINVVAITGAQSFSPNPVTVGAGQRLSGTTLTASHIMSFSMTGYGNLANLGFGGSIPGRAIEYLR